MKIYRDSILCFLVSLCVLFPSIGKSDSVPSSQMQLNLSFAPIVKQTAPAVVNIYARRVVKQRQRHPLFNDPMFRRFFGGRGFGVPKERVQRSLGSGVIVKASGIIVTNNHVIKNGTEIDVVLADKTEFRAKVLLKDEKTDLAILKIDPGNRKLPFLPIRKSEGLEVGDLVLAIGNPFGVGQTVTSGIVSALARSSAGISNYQFFIQTDAAINPGNSGGALVDNRGNLIGINTAIYSRSGGSNGIGFAIPANTVQLVLKASEKGSIVHRPWLGARFQPLTGKIAQGLGLDKAQGVLVREIIKGGPFDEAGIKTGDVIQRVDEQNVSSIQELQFQLTRRGIGGRVELYIYRGGDNISTSLSLIKAPEIPPRNETKIGLNTPLTTARVGNLSPAVSEELRQEFKGRGVVVFNPGRSLIARAGVKRGDQILSVQDVSITSVRDLKRVLASDPTYWKIRIKRGNRIFTLRFGG